MRATCKPSSERCQCCQSSRYPCECGLRCFRLRQPLRCSWAGQFHWLSSPPRWLRDEHLLISLPPWVLLLCVIRPLQVGELAGQIAVRTYFVSVTVPFVGLPAFAAACSIKSATSFG